MPQGLGPLEKMISRWTQPVDLGNMPGLSGADNDTLSGFPDTLSVRKLPDTQGQPEYDFGPAQGLLPPQPLVSAFESAAKQYDVPVNILMAMAQQESSYRPDIVNSIGATGLMQYIPDTANALGIDPTNPVQSIDAAAMQLRHRLDNGWSLVDAVRGHFAGPDRDLWGDDTQAYGPEVLAKAKTIGHELYPNYYSNGVAIGETYRPPQSAVAGIQGLVEQESAHGTEPQPDNKAQQSGKDKEDGRSLWEQAKQEIYPLQVLTADEPETTPVIPGSLHPIGAREAAFKNKLSFKQRKPIVVKTKQGHARIIPTVTEDGTELTPQQAHAHFKKTGANYGVFDTVEQAQKFYEQKLQAAQNYDSFGEAVTKSLANAPERFLQSVGGIAQSLGEQGAENRKTMFKRGARSLGVSVDDYVRLRIAQKKGIIEQIQASGAVPTDRSHAQEVVAYLKQNFGDQITDRDVQSFSTSEQGLAQWGEELRKSQRGTIQEVNAEPGSLAYYANLTVGSMAQMAPMILATLITRSPKLGASIMFGQVYGTSYGQARDQGLSPDQAQLYSSLQAAAEAIPEAIVISKLLEPGTKLLGNVLKGGATEFAQEELTSILQIGIDKGLINEDMTWEQARQRLIDSGIVGLLTGGVMGGAFGLGNKAAQDTPDETPDNAAVTAAQPPPNIPPADHGPVSKATNAGIEAAASQRVVVTLPNGEQVSGFAQDRTTSADGEWLTITNDEGHLQSFNLAHVRVASAASKPAPRPTVGDIQTTLPPGAEPAGDVPPQETVTAETVEPDAGLPRPTTPGGKPLVQVTNAQTGELALVRADHLADESNKRLRTFDAGGHARVGKGGTIARADVQSDTPVQAGQSQEDTAPAWQQTRQQFYRDPDHADQDHEELVEAALNDGERVSPEVLLDYPELVEQFQAPPNASQSATADMDAAELRATLLADEQTGIGNRRAFMEAPASATVGIADLDGLKWVNDTFGHGAGDQLLQAAATALNDSTGGNAYRLHGDEFAIHADSEQSAQGALERANTALGQMELTFERPDGTTETHSGFGFSYGTGQDLASADAKLGEHKQARTRSGERVERGQAPASGVGATTDGNQGNNQAAQRPQGDAGQESVAAPDGDASIFETSNEAGTARVIPGGPMGYKVSYQAAGEDRPRHDTYNYADRDEAIAAAQKMLVVPEPPGSAPETDTQQTEPPQHETAGAPVIEVPVDALQLSEDVPQFKSDADDATGVVESLQGTFDRTGVAPIQVWQRKDGTLEVISGRHRLDLARRSGEQTIPAQVHREADGFTKEQAARLDAELNIRDEQGSIADYATYFRQAELTPQEAEQRGLLGRSKGRSGYAIARDASEETFAAFSAGQISDEAARRISEAAPNNERLQLVGVQTVGNGKSIAEAVNTMRAVQTLSAESAEQGDMFGLDDSAMQQAQAMARVAGRHQREIRERLASVRGAAKRPDKARELGVDVKDPAAVNAEIQRMQTHLERWSNWNTDPELVAQIRSELQPTGQGAQQDEPSAAAQPDAFELTPTTPEGLQAEADAAAAAQAEQDAQRRAVENRDEADRNVDGFTLTGSDAEADQAMAAGQEALFGNGGVPNGQPEMTAAQAGYEFNLPLPKNVRDMFGESAHAVVVNSVKLPAGSTLLRSRIDIRSVNGTPTPFRSTVYRDSDGDLLHRSEVGDRDEGSPARLRVTFRQPDEYANRKLYDQAGRLSLALFQEVEQEQNQDLLFADTATESNSDQDTSAPEIENFGEELPPARRNAAQRLSDELTDEQIAAQPLSKLWPVSDIQKLGDDAAVWPYVARAMVPRKPSKRRPVELQRWVEMVKMARDLASRGLMRQLEDVDSSADKYAVLRDPIAKARLLRNINRSQWDRIDDVREAPDAARVVPGEDGKAEWLPTPHVAVQIDGKNVRFDGSPNVAAHVDAIHQKLAETADIKSPRMRFEIRVVRKTGEAFINKKGDSERRRLATFDNVQDARDYLKGNHNALVDAWADSEQRLNVTKADMRRGTNQLRNGPKYRDGDVTVEQFNDTFGFKGGEFGGWVKQGKNEKERQALLNSAYDALRDLADIVGLPPRAMSLNGQLGIAFGARGRGRASAHFEPDTLVINLTKTRGAGSLAHEWLHGLDNYFARLRGTPEFKGNQGLYRQEAYVTYNPETYYRFNQGGAKRTLPESVFERMIEGERVPGYGKLVGPGKSRDNWTRVDGVRPEVGAAFANLVSALNDSPMTKRAQALDSGTTDGYWSRIIERAARSFESYIISRMNEKGYQNDFLANVATPEEFQRAMERYPYLTPEEIEPVAKAFDTLFNTIEYKTDKAGNVALFSRPQADDQLQRELAAVPEVRDAQGRLLAPNGQPSNLDELQWKQTRTPRFRAWFGDWEAVANQKFLNGPAVAQLSGDEFSPNGSPLTKRVTQWYVQQGVERVETPGIGSVRLDEKAVKNSFSHGMSRTKATAFAAVPEVLRKGRIIHREPMHGARDDGTVYHVAAPITIGGDAYVADVMVRADANTNRMYVHEVALQETLRASAFETSAGAAEAGVRAGADAGAIRSVLRRIYAVNPDTVSKVVDASGEPLVAHHGAPDARGIYGDEPGFQSTNERLFGRDSQAAYFFTNDRAVARTYADDNRAMDYQNAQNAVLAKYLSIKNPMVIDAAGASWGQRGGTRTQGEQIAEAKANGHDGLIIRNTLDTYNVNGNRRADVYVAFEPTQIKSAEPEAVRDMYGDEIPGSGPNRGTFDPNERNTRYSRGNAPMRRDPAASAREINQALNDPLTRVRRHVPVTVSTANPVDIYGAKAEGVEGVYDNGEVTLFAGNLSSPQRAREVLRHEAVGHFSMERMLGEAFKPTINRVRKMHDNKRIAPLVQEVRNRYPGLDTQSDMFQQELIAVMAESGVKMPVMQRALASLRAFLRRLGLDDGGISEIELRGLLARAGRDLAAGGRVPRVRLAPTFSASSPTFYSHMAQVMADKLPKQAPARQMKQAIEAFARKGQIKAEELEWGGIGSWLDGQDGKVTKAELLDAFAGLTVRTEETIHQRTVNRTIEQWIDDADARVIERGGEYYAEYGGNEILRAFYSEEDAWDALRDEAVDSIDEHDTDDGGTKYKDYTLPGGENYREILIQLPAEKDAAPLFSEWMRDKGYDLSEQHRHIAEYQREHPPKEKTEYKSSHFDEPNILAHLRVNQRNDGRTLFIEEVQSDLHQEGRKKGYGLQSGFVVKDEHGQLLARQPTREAAERIAEQYRNGNTPVQQATGETGMPTIVEPIIGDIQGVPNAPFKKSWPLLTIKRAIRLGVDNGAEQVAWTTGAQQAARYDLSKRLDRIEYEPVSDDDGEFTGEYDLNAYSPEGALVMEEEDLTLAEVEDHVGKEIAEKIQAGEGQPKPDSPYRDWRILSGLDLQVGGEGMHQFYDVMLPRMVDKYIKKWGAKTGSVEINIDAEQPDVGAVVHGFPITPAMREAALAGQPLFSRKPVRTVPVSLATLMTGADSALWKSANAAYRTKLQGRSIENANLGAEVRFSAEGRKKSLSKGRRNRLRMSTVSALDSLARRAVPYEAAIDDKGRADVERFVYAVAPLRIEGDVYAVRLTLKEITGESGQPRFYDFAGFSIEKPGAIDRSRASEDALSHRGPPGSGVSLDSLIASVKDDRPLFSRSSQTNGPSGARNMRLVARDTSGRTTAAATVKDGEWYIVSTDTDLLGYGIRRAKTRKRAEEMLSQGGQTVTIETPGRASEQQMDMGDSRIDLPEGGYVVNTARTFRYLAQDKFNSLERIQNAAERQHGELADNMNPYMLESVHAGRTQARSDAFEEEHLEPLLTGLQQAGIGMQSAREYMADMDTSQDVLERFGDMPVAELYLYARHAPEANAALEEINPGETDLSGMSDSHAAQIMQALEHSKGGAGFAALGRRIDDITAATRKTLVDSGLEKQSTIRDWENKYTHYVPLKSVPAGETGMPRRGQGFDTRGSSSMRRLGRVTPATDILANIVAAHQTAITRAEKNRVGQALLKFAQTHPDESLWTVNQPRRKRRLDPVTDTVQVYFDPKPAVDDNVFVVRVGGVEHHIDFNKENVDAMRIAKSMKNLSAAETGVLVRAGMRINRFLSMVSTSLNPEFVITNFARDLQTVAINLNDSEAHDLKYRILKGAATGKAYRAIRRYQKGKRDGELEQYYHDFVMDGAETGWTQGYSSMADLSKDLGKRMANMRPGTWPFAKRSAKNLFELIGDMNSGVENGIRLSTYMQARKAGVSRDKAAALAKNISVNFNRKGEWGNGLNAAYLFYNAATQGSARIVQAAARSKKARHVMYGAVALGVVMDLANRWIADDDEDGRNRYDQIPEYIKQMNWIIMLPENEAWPDWVPDWALGPNGDYIKFPMPYGYNMLAYTGQKIARAMSAAMGDIPDYSVGEEAMNYGIGMMSAFNPVGYASSWLQIAMPTVADPFIQWAENKNWAGIPIHPEADPYGPPPPNFTLYFSGARAWSKYVTEQLNMLSGGTAVTPGAINWSPEALDHFTDFAMGGAGRFLLDMADLPFAVKEAITGEEPIEAYTIPFVGKLYGTPRDGASRSLFYDRRTELTYLKNELKAARKGGNSQRTQKLRKNRGAEVDLLPRMEAASDRLRNLRQWRDATESGSLQEDEKRKRLQSIEQHMDAIYHRFNRRYAESVYEQDPSQISGQDADIEQERVQG